jgi:hypothetical protein
MRHAPTERAAHPHEKFDITAEWIVTHRAEGCVDPPKIIARKAASNRAQRVWSSPNPMAWRHPSSVITSPRARSPFTMAARSSRFGFSSPICRSRKYKRNASLTTAERLRLARLASGSTRERILGGIDTDEFCFGITVRLVIGNVAGEKLYHLS